MCNNDVITGNIPSKQLTDSLLVCPLAGPSRGVNGPIGSVILGRGVGSIIRLSIVISQPELSTAQFAGLFKIPCLNVHHYQLNSNGMHTQQNENSKLHTIPSDDKDEFYDEKLAETEALVVKV